MSDTSPLPNGRNKDGTFAKGAPGISPGRPKGSRTSEIRSLLESNSQQLMRSVIDAALGGDVSAARYLLSLMIAPPRSNPIFFPMPKVNSAETAKEALEAILAAQCDGTLTADEAESLVKTVNSYITIVEAADFDARLKRLEESH